MNLLCVYLFLKSKQARIDETIRNIQSHNGVNGVIILDSQTKTIIRTTLKDTKEVQKYSTLALHMTEATRTELSEMESGNSNNALQMLRIKTKKNEVMIAPDDEFILVVIQDPSGPSSSF